MNCHLEPANERGINLILYIAGKEDQTTAAFETLKKIADLKVCVTIRSMLDFGASAEQSLSLVKKQNGVTLFGFSEGGFEIFFRFTYPLGNDSSKVNLIQDQTKEAGDDFGCKRLAGTGVAREESFHSGTVAETAKTPLVVDAIAQLKERGDFKDLAV